MATRRSTVDALLEREARQSSAVVNDAAASDSSAPPRPNAVWRRKVIHWYFTLVAALRRQHAAARAGDDVPNPFDRSSVHVTAFLLDNYLASLPAEAAVRYGRDRPAYQLLATTCLLLGMRLAQHDRIREARRDREEAAEGKEGGRPLKRAKTHRAQMDSAAAGGTTNSPPPAPPSGGVAIPNAAAILRISAAPKSLSERHVLSMVREVTGARSFPRARVVTPLDFVRALRSPRTVVDGEDGYVSLGPNDVEEASRLADVAVKDAELAGCRPSVVACASIALALARSDGVDLNMALLRQRVQYSIFGTHDDPALLTPVMRTEASLLASVQVRAPLSRNRQIVPTAHLIPLEDE